jgi:peptidoglycan/xylan/chitin deacetylase (PgdA/CDA1 family)
MKLITTGLNQYYRSMQRRYPHILWFGDPSRHEIALTFDDGPHPRDTPQVLEILERHKIQATFFLVGKAVEQYPALTEKIHQSGHQIGIHCYRHIPFQLENPSTLCNQLERTKNILANICSIPSQSLKDLRPPYGAFTRKTLSHLSKWGYRVVMWNSIPPHWMQPFTWTTNQIMDQSCPGSVIVLHDGHGHGTKAAKIVDWIVPRLKEQGYNFVTTENMKGKNSHES